jgi:hypothetical protein
MAPEHISLFFLNAVKHFAINKVKIFFRLKHLIIKFSDNMDKCDINPLSLINQIGF